MNERFIKQMKFLCEIDRLKEELRQNYICSGNRRENDAEHMWHIAVMSMILEEYAPEDVDIHRVTRMLLIHDLIEIYAGDTYCYDTEGNKGKFQREMDSAKRLFALLPEDQEKEYMDLWLEFEHCQTKESIFANTMDRIQPSMLNLASDGKSWLEHGIARSQVLERNKIVLENDGPFGEFLRSVCDKAVEEGYLKP